MIGKEFPDYFCNLIQKDLPEVSLDIGVTQEGSKVKLSLFEVNWRGIAFNIPYPDVVDEAILRCQYIRYLAKNLNII